MTDTRQETLRECIERGGRGEFAKALLALYDDPRSMECTQEAYAKANKCETGLLCDAASAIFNYREVLADAFPYLAHLDEPAINWPDLRGEE